MCEVAGCGAARFARWVQPRPHALRPAPCAPTWQVCRVESQKRYSRAVPLAVTLVVPPQQELEGHRGLSGKGEAEPVPPHSGTRKGEEERVVARAVGQLGGGSEGRAAGPRRTVVGGPAPAGAAQIRRSCGNGGVGDSGVQSGKEKKRTTQQVEEFGRGGMEWRGGEGSAQQRSKGVE